MQMTPRLRHIAMYALILTLCSALMAQGNGRGKDNDKGRGGPPPGQARQMEHGKGLPPGQAKKYFRIENRTTFYTHYRGDVDRWRDRKRPVFVVGMPIVKTYVIQPVPRSVWVNVVVAPPPGYQYGYYGGYVVAYNPTTRIIADVLDLVDAVRTR
jgi:hypothetical protein